MFVKKFFNERSGAIQMNFDLNESRIYITIADPFDKTVKTENGKKRKFDWDNGLNYTIAEDNSEEIIMNIKNVLSGKKENISAVTYNTPKVQKSLAFGQKSNGVYALVIKHGNKDQRIFEFGKKEEAKIFYKMISSFFTNAFLANLIIDGILSKAKPSTQQNKNVYKKNNYSKQQNENTNKVETEDIFGDLDNNDIDEDNINEKAEEINNTLDLDDMF